MASIFYLGKAQSRLAYWTIMVALFAALVLSYLSWIEFCVEHCSATLNYRFCSLPFSVVGLTIFPLLIICHSLSCYSPIFSTLTGWILCGALGSEVVCIGVQKYQIGSWCPICVSIAFSISVACSAFLTGYIKNLYHAITQNNHGEIMNKIKQGMASLSFVFIGFLVALVGISKVNPAEAAALEMKEKLAFGKKGSNIEVYFVSDWYCKACRKVEPIVEELYPEIRTKAVFFFIDYPIHKKSINFIPYNISFLINNKAQYFQARHALDELAAANESPTDTDVVDAVKKAKLKYIELPYLDVKTGMDYFDSIVKKYGLNSTPVLIVTDTKTNKIIKLEGSEEITKEKIQKAMEDIVKK